MKLKRFIVVIVIFFITLYLSACASTYRYSLQAPHAYISVKDYHTFSNPLDIAIFKDPYQCKILQNFPNRNYRDGKLMTINGDKLVTLMAVYIAGYQRLVYVFSFKPKANQIYWVTTTAFSTNNNKNRYVRLRITNNKKLVKIYPRTWNQQQCLYSNLNAIRPLNSLTKEIYKRNVFFMISY